MAGRWRDGLGWVIAALAVAAVAAAGVAAWLSNADKRATVVTGLVAAAVVGAAAAPAPANVGRYTATSGCLGSRCCRSDPRKAAPTGRY